MNNHNDIKERIVNLTQKIIYHNKKYHGEDSPEISDFEYDLLFNELKDLREKYPQHILSNNIIEEVGFNIKKGFTPFSHPIIMGSLENAMNLEDVKAFIKRREKDLGEIIDEYSLSLKLDGLALELIYQDGNLTVASTRGDGLVGENVTKNARQISNIPYQIITQKSVPPIMVIRGEVIMTKTNFNKHNEVLAKEGKPPASNPRNVAAGTMRQLDEKIVKSRNLVFSPYGLTNWLECCKVIPELDNQKNQINFLQEIGFEINENHFLAENIKGIDKYYQNIKEKRSSFDYEIDGIVIKINSGKTQNLLGESGKRPRYAIAWKLPPEVGKTQLEKVHFQVGRTGKITPVANLTPIRLSGVIVKRATLHNFREIRNKDIRIGDYVEIIRSGDVIPKITGVDKKRRNGNEKEIIFPNVCPVCKSILKTEVNGILTFCRNQYCPSRQFQNIIHFVSKDAMDIEGLGKEQIQDLIQAGKIKDYSDLFALKSNDFKVLERVGDKLINNLINSINRAKNVDLSKFIYALGIEGVGSKTAQIIAKKFITLDKIINSKKEELLDLNNIGLVIVNYFYEYFNNPKNLEIIKLMKERGVTINPYKELIFDKSNKLYNKKILFTGTLTMPRRRAKELAESVGAEIVSTISEKLDYLVVGENPSSKKQKKIKELHIIIITEEEFLKLLNG